MPAESETSIADRVKNILHERLGVNPEQITPTATLQDLGVDSLDGVEIVMALEEDFEIEIPDEDLEAKPEDTITVQDIVDYIVKKVL